MTDPFERTLRGAAALVGVADDVSPTGELDLHGPAKLISPVMKLIFERVATTTVHQMTQVLNQLDSTA